MRILACHADGDSDCITTMSQLLRTDYPGFSADLPATLERNGFTPESIVKLVGALRSAGVLQSHDQ
jgi:hypothetical protein